MVRFIILLENTVVFHFSFAYYLHFIFKKKISVGGKKNSDERYVDSFFFFFCNNTHGFK